MTRPLVIVAGPDLDDGALAVVNRGGWTYNVHPVARLVNPYAGGDAFVLNPAIDCRTVTPAEIMPGAGPPATVTKAEAVETAAEILADLLEEEPTL